MARSSSFAPNGDAIQAYRNATCTAASPRLARRLGVGSPIRVVIVDDHAIVRLGLLRLFETARNIQVVAEAGTAAEAIAAVRAQAPDVAIVDVRLPDRSGVEACRQIRSEHPDTRVVVLTSFGDEDAVIASVLAGASGYLLKQTQPEELIAAVEAAACGGSLLDQSATETVLRWMRDGGPAAAQRAPRLSEQQRRILPLIAEGKTNREIGATLFLSEHTVKTYVSSLLKKLRLARRAEAAAYVARHQHLARL
jgi:DNA-binding NarL/FixJ family response regulator